MFLTQRSYQKELLDNDRIPFEDIKQNMKELNFINTWLGGHQITIKGLQQFINNSAEKKWHICEIGCGGGDNLRALDKWAQKKQLQLRFTGIDLKKECIDFAKECTTTADHYQWITADYASVNFADDKPDIIFSSLFCHHFTDNALHQMMRWMHANSRSGFFINDLHRHTLAYHSIKLLTQLFSSSYLVKNDAPLSVKRGFTRQEWQDILQHSGINNYAIHWKWAFRWLITVK